MTSIREAVRRLFQPEQVLPPGMYHYQAPLDDPRDYRLHLRLEPDGSGMLVVNASTVLHLNQTAAEYAYHLVHQNSEDETVQQIAHRYRVSRSQALRDYRDFTERIDLLVDRQDLDPEIFLDIDPTSRIKLSAPIRMDTALTSRVPPGRDKSLYPFPEERVELTTSDWQEVLDKAWQAGILQVIFTGGEPTLRDDLIELIQLTEANGQVAGLVTDGLKFSDQDYLEAVLESGLDHIVILFQPGDEQILDILDKLIAADLFITVHLTFTTENMSEMESALMNVTGRDIHALSMSFDAASLADSVIALHDQVAKLDIPFVWGLPVPFPNHDLGSLEPDQTESGQNSAQLFVEPDGTVWHSLTDSNDIGNLHRQPWGEVWTRLKDL